MALDPIRLQGEPNGGFGMDDQDTFSLGALAIAFDSTVRAQVQGELDRVAQAMQMQNTPDALNNAAAQMAQVLGRFLDALGQSLSAEAMETGTLDLDFVYGRWKDADRTLEPLDGQQRLTTLFLLHWYLASLDRKFDEFRSWITLPSGGSCFTYRTRPAAREFFDALVRQPAPLDTIGAK